MRILITGAGGMLGSSMVPALASAGHAVYPTDLRAPAPAADYDLRATDCTSTRPAEPSARGHIAPMALLDVRREEHVDGPRERIAPGRLHVHVWRRHHARHQSAFRGEHLPHGRERCRQDCGICGVALAPPQRAELDISEPELERANVLFRAQSGAGKDETAENFAGIVESAAGRRLAVVVLAENEDLEHLRDGLRPFTAHSPLRLGNQPWPRPRTPWTQ